MIFTSSKVSRLKIDCSSGQSQNHIRLGSFLKRKFFGKQPANSNLDFGGDKSFVDDLIIELGAVSSRVALLLRSAEAKPMFSRFVFPVKGKVEGRFDMGGCKEFVLQGG